MVSVSVVNVLTDPHATPLVASYMALRSRVFVKQKQWALHQCGGLEYEQYDDFGQAYYVLAHIGTTVLAGARLLRCNSQIGYGMVQYSYMIRDAYLGQIDLPAEICDEAPPSDAAAWEFTRFVIEPGQAGLSARILIAANDWIKAQRGTRCLFLGSPAFMRIARSMGWQPLPLGKVTGDASGRFVAFMCNTK